MKSIDIVQKTNNLGESKGGKKSVSAYYLDNSELHSLPHRVTVSNNNQLLSHGTSQIFTSTQFR